MREKLLFISAENPFPQDSGGKLRTGNILNILLSKYAVDLVTYAGERKGSSPVTGNLPVQYEVSRTVTYRKAMLRSLIKLRNCSYMSHVDLDMKPEIERLCRKERYRHVFISHSLLGCCIDIVKNILPDAIIITDAHNFESGLSAQLAGKKQGAGRLYFKLNAAWTRRDELNVMEKTDLLLTTSDEDGEQFRRLSPRNAHKVHVIPNFISMSSYNESKPAAKENWIILPGNMNYFPNVNGARYFYREIYPLVKARIPDIQWYIVGRDVHPEVAELARQDESIVITGYVKSVADYIRRSKVVIAPLLEGSGTRLKILESWALETPVVSTTKGAEGLRCRDAHDIMIADEAGGFADKVVALLQDEESNHRMARHAMATLLENYEAGSVREKVLSLV